MNNKKKVYIVIPVFNDWDCLEVLLKQINDELRNETELSIYIVNDCSSISCPKEVFCKFENINIINLTRNMGHQKAISIGLSYVCEHTICDAVIVMDADGEDRPEDLKPLLHKFELERKIVFAKRKKRQETLLFRLFYQLYKFFFLLLVGKELSFGNFCIIPHKSLKKLVHMSEIWNHFSGGVIRSKLPYVCLSLNRGKRLIGKSKMNLVSLIIHGISSYTVHLDVVVVRLLIFFAMLLGLSLLGTFIVVVLKFYTNLAMPGWATYTIIGFYITILQTLFIILNLTATVLYYRTQKLFIPAIHYNNYISKNEEIFIND